MNKNEWDISKRPHTQTKLQIIRKVFNMWLTVWNAPRQQSWISKEWYVMDLFAGRGYYKKDRKEVSGSSLIFLKEILSKEKNLRTNKIFIKLFFVEKNGNNFNELEKRIKKFIKTNSELKDIIKIYRYKNDCNEVITNIIKKVKSTPKNPLFILIDPSGLQIKKQTLEKIVELKNPKDIILNYMVEGVRRTGGVIKKAYQGKNLNVKELKTMTTLKEFFGKNTEVINKNERRALESYVSVFTNKGLRVVGYDIPYPDKKNILYYLIYASRKPSITRIVEDIYYREKKDRFGQPSLFGEKFDKESILTINPKIQLIKRKSLLYKTKVEYGNWTINHIVGCMHGCNFPCYAMMMAKRFGWIRDYDDWRKPRIAKNTLEILEKEIPKYKSEIDFVHLCFMTDPFMYDFEEEDLIPEIKNLTLKIIKRLNKEKIRVTTLTKGFYPDEILDKKFLPTNEYGITLVSLNENFKKDFEPFSAPYDKRIKSLEKLAKAGLKTWVSMEPYPIPKYDKKAENIESILERIKFVKKIIFGKLNYRRLNYCNVGFSSQIWKNNHDFYKGMAQKVINFCKKNSIEYHIKFGTPLCRAKTKNIFR